MQEQAPPSNFYGDSAGGTPISTIPNKSVNYDPTSDIAQQYKNNRDIEQNQGDMFAQYFGGEASRRNGLENAALLHNQGLYDQLEQTPGYSQSESDAILGNRQDGGNNYRDLLNTDYNSNYLTPNEQQGMQGNPYDPMNQLHPETISGNNNTAFQGSQGYIQGAQDQLNQNYGTTQSGMNDALDLSQTSATGLKLGQHYQSDMGAIVDATGKSINAATGNQGLSMSGEYGRQAGMTDQEVADAAAMGGQAVGAQSRAAIQDLDRQAAASGNSSPLAVAAMRSQFEDQNAVNSADATVKAQLAARQQQRDAATGVEKTRLGSEQYKTNAQMTGAEALANFAGNAATQQEQMRQSTSQDIANRKMGIAANLGQMGQQNAMYANDANLANEQNWANRGQQGEEFNQATGYGASANAEQQQANRAAGIAQNRQGVNQANQTNQFNRGYQVNATLSGANADIANARRQGQQETRGYYTGQQQYQGQQANQQNQNLLQNRQQTQQGRQAATNGSAAWELGNKNAGNWFTKNVLPVMQLGASTAKSLRP